MLPRTHYHHYFLLLLMYFHRRIKIYYNLGMQNYLVHHHLLIFVFDSNFFIKLKSSGQLKNTNGRVIKVLPLQETHRLGWRWRVASQEMVLAQRSWQRTSILRQFCGKRWRDSDVRSIIEAHRREHPEVYHGYLGPFPIDVWWLILRHAIVDSGGRALDTRTDYFAQHFIHRIYGHACSSIMFSQLSLIHPRIRKLLKSKCKWRDNRKYFKVIDVEK